MKQFTSIVSRFTAIAVLAIAALVGFGGGSAAAAQIPYVPGQPLPSIKTPVFNTYTNIPAGVGNEADFVRLRPSTGNGRDNGSDGARNALYTDPLNAACNVGDMYDVRTYVHNGADADLNNNGTGPAIAHNTTVAMSAPLNKAGKSFTFNSTISASNAPSVSDSGTLNCGSNVQLQLVPKSVYVYTKALGWNAISDSAVNGSTKIGSMNLGSGDVWGCWDERIVVVYTVKVVEVPQVPLYTCDLLSVTKIDARKYKFDVTYTAKNGATFKSVSYDYGDGQTGSDNTHTYDKDGTFKVIATVSFLVNGEVVTSSGDACAKPVTVAPENCDIPGKENYPKNAPECQETPVALPNTGAGGMVGIFAAVSAAGAFAYRYVAARRLEV